MKSRVMRDSRIRAPIQILEELLGEPDSDPGDKSSTSFVHAFDGEEIVDFDFHKPEWNGHPECVTDRKYVWSVEGRDAARFCQWLSNEVVKRVPREVSVL
jgi:hypothetical protein